MKNGLITGASRGIGLSIAIKLAKEGYRLFLQGRDESALAESCRMVEKNGGQATSIIAELSSHEGVLNVVNKVGKEPLSFLINNAGMAVVKPFDKITFDEWQQTIAVNITAPFLLCQKLLPNLFEGASIVNVLSIAARTGFPNWSSYCMSKFALEGFMQSIRDELRPRGIRVINIYPGAVNTEIWNNIPGKWQRENMLSPEEIADAVFYAISRPTTVLVENIILGSLSGTL